MKTPAGIKNLYQNCTSGYNRSNSGSITVSTADNTATGSWFEHTTPNDDIQQGPIIISTPGVYPTPLKNNKKGDEDMRYLYEVILVNPKNDTFVRDNVVAKSETSALMKAYNDSKFKDVVDFDELKADCRILLEWKKKESLKKAIETIKKAVE